MSSTTYAAAVDHLNALGLELAPTPNGAPRRKWDLAHMRTLAHALGDPQSTFPSILIAGTNGKGSTAATLAGILTAAGYRTALYTSPHLVRLNERIQIDGLQIDDEDFARLYFQADAAATRLVTEGKLPHPPSYFEILTTVAFLYFAEQKVDIAVLEVGLGGRLDATNIVEPILSILTDIALDHQEYLGATIAAITREKAGILRPHGTLITLPQHPEANQAIGEAAATLNLRAINAANFIPAQTQAPPAPTLRVPHPSQPHREGWDPTIPHPTQVSPGAPRPASGTWAEPPQPSVILNEEKDPRISPVPSPAPTLRVPHPSQPHREGWDIEQSATAALSNAPSRDANQTSLGLAWGFSPTNQDLHKEGLQPRPLTPNHYTLTLDNQPLEINSPLPGHHQQRNLALAIAAAGELRNQKGYNIANAAIEAGIRDTHWPGRLELLHFAEGPPLLLDVAHNPAGAWTLRAALAQLPDDQPRTLIFSCLRDKSLSEMSRILFPLFDAGEDADPARRHDHLIVTPIANPRAATVEDLLTAAHALGVPVHAAPHVAAALAQARAVTPAHGIILATGSVYLIGELRHLALHL